jgi:hypothetical protein
VKLNYVLRATAAGSYQLQRQIAVRCTGHGDNCFSECGA